MLQQVSRAYTQARARLIFPDSAEDGVVAGRLDLLDKLQAELKAAVFGRLAWDWTDRAPRDCARCHDLEGRLWSCRKQKAAHRRYMEKTEDNT